MVTTTIRILHRLVGARRLLRARANDRLKHRGAEIERAHIMSGLHQIARHRAAHIADADECDGGHCFLPTFPICHGPA